MREKQSGKKSSFRIALVAASLLSVAGNQSGAVLASGPEKSRSNQQAMTEAQAADALPSAPSAPMTVDQAKDLLREFDKAQSEQVKGLEQRQKFELKELKLSQTARFKEWEKKERDDRHEYFASHPKGPDRRSYVQDFINRRKSLFQSQSDERAHKISDQEARIKAFRGSLDDRRKEFLETMKKGSKPPKP